MDINYIIIIIIHTKFRIIKLFFFTYKYYQMEIASDLGMEIVF